MLVGRHLRKHDRFEPTGFTPPPSSPFGCDLESPIPPPAPTQLLGKRADLRLESQGDQDIIHQARSMVPDQQAHAIAFGGDAAVDAWLGSLVGNGILERSSYEL